MSKERGKRSIEEVFEGIGEKELFDYLDEGMAMLDRFVRADELDALGAIRRGFMCGLAVFTQIPEEKVMELRKRVLDYTEEMTHEPEAEEEMLHGRAVAAVLEFLEKSGEKAGIMDKAEMIEFAKKKFREKEAKEKETRH